MTLTTFTSTTTPTSKGSNMAPDSHVPTHPFPKAAFADVIDANTRFAETFTDDGLTGRAARELAVVTCMDSRINPLALLGMSAGDVKILRNAGARVTDDVVRTLVLATYLLNVSRVLVIPHTECKMASASEDQIHDTIATQFGIDTRSLDFSVITDQERTLSKDLTKIRSHPLLPPTLIVGGAIYDVRTGCLNPVNA